VVSQQGIYINEDSDEDMEDRRDISDLSYRIQKYKFYFQYRIDELNEDEKFNPKICIGVCRENFLVNQDLSRQEDVWCINCATGDKFNKKRWRSYYNIEGMSWQSEEKSFQVGTVIGILVDLDRRTLHFYKDGVDLGQAFMNMNIKDGVLYPFV
jgi:hypothetical protein